MLIWALTLRMLRMLSMTWPWGMAVWAAWRLPSWTRLQPLAIQDLEMGFAIAMASLSNAS